MEYGINFAHAQSQVRTRDRACWTHAISVVLCLSWSWSRHLVSGLVLIASSKVFLWAGCSWSRHLESMSDLVSWSRHQECVCGQWMVLLSTKARGDTDWLCAWYPNFKSGCIFLHRDHEKADVIFLSEESEQELTSESDGSPVKKRQRWYWLASWYPNFSPYIFTQGQWRSWYHVSIRGIRTRDYFRIK